MRAVFAIVILLLFGAGCGHSASTLDYVALGDSIPAGAGESGGRSFVYDYARYIQWDTGARVRVRNLGTNGLTAGGLLEQLRHDGRVRELVANAEVVTVSVGLNDLIAPLGYASNTCGGHDNQACFRSALASLEPAWSAILSDVSLLRANRPTLIRVTNDYNAFTDVQTQMRLGAARIKVFTRYLRRFNAYRCATARKHQIACADVARVFNGPSTNASAYTRGLIGSDGHPSSKGHRLIARTLRALGYAPLREYTHP